MELAPPVSQDAPLSELPKVSSVSPSGLVDKNLSERWRTHQTPIPSARGNISPIHFPAFKSATFVNLTRKDGNF